MDLAYKFSHSRKENGDLASKTHRNVDHFAIVCRFISQK